MAQIRNRSSAGKVYGWLRFLWPSKQRGMCRVAFGVVLLLAALLRFWGLGERPLHHDEAQHAYFSWIFMHNILGSWPFCFLAQGSNGACYRYDPLLHGPFQFHVIALVYRLCSLVGIPIEGANNVTARIPAALLGTALVGLPYFLRDRLGTWGGWLASFLLAISPGMVYFSRFTREDIYMAFFTLLLIVAIARYIRARDRRWLIWAAVALTLSYATKEATFFTIALLGSFAGAVIVWELGSGRVIRKKGAWLPETLAFPALFLYLLVFGSVALCFFGWLKGLARSLSNVEHVAQADAVLAVVKDWTTVLLLLGFIGLCAFMLFKRSQGDSQQARVTRFDPIKQPLLRMLTTLPWRHWTVAVLTAWIVFAVLFTVLFTNLRTGIGDGVWQGLYYWLKQQEVARGGQPWYYYLLLIPLYEQIGVVFGLVGLIYCLCRPTRFRLFLAYWFVGSVCIYSWAGEKMPWLMIHMVLPLLLLAALAIAPLVRALVGLLHQRKKPCGRHISAFGGLVLACMALIVTLQNMFQVNYVHAEDAPHEMMIYVQTTTDVNAVMKQIEALDREYYHGKHEISIAVTRDATWPFAWYLRNYSNVAFQNSDVHMCVLPRENADVMIAGGHCIGGVLAKGKGTYQALRYSMRRQWDQGYMPPRCVPQQGKTCEEQPYIGVGPLLWLSYGDNPPPGAQFDPMRAACTIWYWWWDRRAIGSTNGSFDMVILLRNDLVQPERREAR
ncbi:uncharacterized protein (TIGR03663 family) [Thermosporothrix hazakensis]|uniref:Uncharacterized protein (TIGR03663 family) n=1 Tax=Thermosporothrix hazakensis TaxID=644383 RepID=A0A326UAF6_THEHA|nr:flippase activity-associated protein Agl23 [Thermosporothrix hazakensis]PZW33030.1 uncharacterized protein (TIGR03663 family) [Thermosporothrix hazakensis]